MYNDPLDKTDPTGNAFFWDDAAGILIGAAVGVTVEVVKDVATGQNITTGSVVAAGVGGAIMGEGVVNAPETLGGSVALAGAARGAAMGAVTNAIQQGTDVATGEQSGFSATSLAVSAGVGALTGGIATKVGTTKVDGVSAGRGNMKAAAQGVRTKIAKGEARTMSASTAVRGAVGSQVADAGKTATEAAGDAAKTMACNSSGPDRCK